MKTLLLLKRNSLRIQYRNNEKAKKISDLVYEIFKKRVFVIAVKVTICADNQHYTEKTVRFADTECKFRL